jgi:Tol biopolymer transport system component
MLEKDPARRPSAAGVAEALRSLPDPKAKRRRIAAGVMLAVCVLLAVIGFRVFGPAPEPVLVQSTLLTGSPGRETGPAFSPDGQSVLYAWDGGHGGKRDIWIKRLDSPDPRQLTSDPADEWDPCWLPDGSAVAFLKAMPGFYQVVTMPIAGGQERVVTRTSNGMAWQEHHLACATAEELVVTDGLRLYAVSLSTGARRSLTDPFDASDTWPRISPDGRRIAFVRSASGFTEIRIMDWTGGPSRRLANTGGLDGLAWASDGQSILYQVATDPKNLWEIAASGGVPRRPPFLTEANATEITLSRDGRKIAYSIGIHDVNLWHVFADGRPPVELAPSTRVESDGAWSPDGRLFAFASDRSGGMEIWVASATGANARRLTNRSRSGSPVWSPDGRWLAFDFGTAETAGVGIIRAEGGPVRQLAAKANVPSWSRDGQWVYYHSYLSGKPEIWKVPVAGGAAVQITHHGGFESRESPDGRYLYYNKSDANDIWRLPLSGEGDEEKVADLDRASQLRCWDLNPAGIYIASPGSKPQIDLLPFAGGRIPVVTLPAELPKYGRCISVHPDGQSFLFPITEPDRREIYVGDVPLQR